MRGERREAKLDQARPVKNSGRGERKGDAVLNNQFLIDYKHNAKSFVLSKKNWDKHAKDAWNDGHYEPLIKVIFDDNSAVAIIEWNTFKEFLNDNGN